LLNHPCERLAKQGVNKQSPTSDNVSYVRLAPSFLRGFCIFQVDGRFRDALQFFETGSCLVSAHLGKFFKRGEAEDRGEKVMERSKKKNSHHVERLQKLWLLWLEQLAAGGFGGRIEDLSGVDLKVQIWPSVVDAIIRTTVVRCV